MSTAQVTNRQRGYETLNIAAEQHVAPVAEEIEQLLAPVLKKGEKLPDVRLLAELGLRLITQDHDAMVEKDEDHDVEIDGDSEPRERCEAARLDLRAECVGAREVCRPIYGTAALRRMGFGNETPEDARLLDRFVGELIKHLKGKLPEPVRKDVKWDVKGTIARLEKKRATLNKARADVQREERKAQLTRRARDGAIATFDDHFGRVAGFYSALFRLAGMHDLAEKLRPTTRKARKEEEAEAAEAAEEGDGASEDGDEGEAEAEAEEGDAAGDEEVEEGEAEPAIG